MKNTNRFFASFLIAIFVISTITGCGNSGGAAPAATANFEGEGTVQGEIKTDEEIAAFQEEEQQNTTTENAENIDNTGHEPEAYGSGNFQDYWQGNDYFDLEGYLHDIGCDDYYGTKTGSSARLEAGETPEGYLAYYGGRKWVLLIHPYYTCTLISVVDGRKWDSQFYVIANPDLENHKVTVNKDGTVITEGVLQLLDTIVNAINEHPGDTNPLQYITDENISWSQT